MYKLILTYDERKAIDFVGYRYPHGNDLFDILWSENVRLENAALINDNWLYKGDIVFLIPEHIAWNIKELIQESTEYFSCGLALFSDDLTKKLIDFCMEIV